MSPVSCLLKSSWCRIQCYKVIKIDSKFQYWLIYFKFSLKHKLCHIIQIEGWRHTYVHAMEPMGTRTNALIIYSYEQYIAACIILLSCDTLCIGESLLVAWYIISYRENKWILILSIQTNVTFFKWQLCAYVHVILLSYGHCIQIIIVCQLSSQEQINCIFPIIEVAYLSSGEWDCNGNTIWFIPENS